MDCPFCRRASGETPTRVIYENDHALVFLSDRGFEDGHMVAVPKKHVENILDCDESTLGHLMAAVKKVANHIVDNCGYGGVNLISASGKAADQSVFHFHIHLIPRKMGDGVEAWPPFAGAKCDADEMFETLRMK